MARGAPYRFRRFARGLNTADGPYGLQEGYEDDPTGRGSECRDCLNVVSRDRGNVRKRPGSVQFVPRQDIHDLSVVDDDSNGRIIYSAGDALYSADESGSETTLIASGLSGDPWQFLRLPDNGGQGPYYGMNGFNSPRQVTTGLTAAVWTASAGAVPNGRFMVYAGNRLWVAGTSADPYAVYFSALGNPRDWPAENVVQFEPKDGEEITGLGVVGPYVLVFKERSIYAIYDLDEGANRKVTDQAGTQSPRSIVPTERGTFFLDGERGVMVTDGQEASRISTQIQPTLDRISQADRATVAGAFWRNHYYLAARLDGSTSHLLDYDSEVDSWWLHSLKATALAVFDRGQTTDLLGAVEPTDVGGETEGTDFGVEGDFGGDGVFGDSSSTTGGLLRLMVDGILLDDGAIYPSFWSGPFHVFNAPDLRKRVREIHYDGLGEIDVHYLFDFSNGPGDLAGSSDFTAGDTFGGAETFGGLGDFGGGTVIGEDAIYSLGVGRAWSFTFGNETEADWELSSYTLRVDMRKD